MHCLLMVMDEFAECCLSITGAHVLIDLTAFSEDRSLQQDIQSLQSGPSLTLWQSCSPSSAIFCKSLCKA